MATLPGRKLYEAEGFVAEEEVVYGMEDGVAIELVRMKKRGS
jgi:hypothetical protein